MILVEIAGFLGADAEERFTATGKRVVSFRVATRVRQGGKDETVWWRVNIWEGFDKVIPYLKKGTAVIVVGEMAKPETYTDRNGGVQISLSLTAGIIKLSPFGRPESRTERGTDGMEGLASSRASAEPESLAHFSMGSLPIEPIGSGAGDDLPF